LDLKRLPAQGGPAGADAAGGFVPDRAENVLVFGPPGSGKTHLLSALGQELVRSGRRVLSRKCGCWCRICCWRSENLKLAALLKRLAGYEALIVDDLGYVQQSREEMEVLFTLLAERYERGSVLLTSTAVLGLGGDLQGPDDDSGGDRPLVHHSVIIELNLPSYRAEQAKKAKQHVRPTRAKGEWTGESQAVRKAVRRRRGEVGFFKHSSGVDGNEMGPDHLVGRATLRSAIGAPSAELSLVGLRPRRARLRFTRRGERNRNGSARQARLFVRIGKSNCRRPLLGARRSGILLSLKGKNNCRLTDYLRREKGQGCCHDQPNAGHGAPFFAWLVDQDFSRQSSETGQGTEASAACSQGPSRSQVRRLLREVELREDIRANAIFSLFLYSGCRVSDLVIWNSAI